MDESFCRSDALVALRGNQQESSLQGKVMQEADKRPNSDKTSQCNSRDDNDASQRECGA